MPRLPYELVVIEADRILLRVVLAPTWDLAIHYWDLYIEYIEACGWTDKEFDVETLRRVDAAWEKRRKVDHGTKRFES